MASGCVTDDKVVTFNTRGPGFFNFGLTLTEYFPFLSQKLSALSIKPKVGL